MDVNKQQIPSFPITDPRFVWVDSSKTDVQRTWRKFGWTPPSQNKK